MPTIKKGRKKTVKGFMLVTKDGSPLDGNPTPTDTTLSVHHTCIHSGQYDFACGKCINKILFDFKSNLRKHIEGKKKEIKQHITNHTKIGIDFSVSEKHGYNAALSDVIEILR